MKNYDSGMEGSAYREVGISVRKGLKRDLGSCNSCSIKYSREYTKVYEIHISTLSIRLCSFCLTDLKDKIDDFASRNKG